MFQHFKKKIWKKLKQWWCFLRWSSANWLEIQWASYLLSQRLTPQTMNVCFSSPDQVVHIPYHLINPHAHNCVWDPFLVYLTVFLSSHVRISPLLLLRRLYKNRAATTSTRPKLKFLPTVKNKELNYLGVMRTFSAFTEPWRIPEQGEHPADVPLIHF